MRYQKLEKERQVERVTEEKEEVIRKKEELESLLAKVTEETESAVREKEELMR